ncbi:MAG: DUF202 domain-containing protein [Acidimicrobiales bacterium]|jgi:hypothetical protein
MSVPATPASSPDSAQERTELAWARSILAVVACVAVLLRRVWPLEGARELAALAGISASAFVWAAAYVLARRTKLRQAERFVLSWRTLQLITAATVGLGVVAFVLGLFSPS